MSHTAPASTPIYDFLFRNTADGLIVTDHDGRITAINPAAAAMFGMTDDSVIGQSAADFFQQYPPLVKLLTQNDNAQRDVVLPHERLAYGIAETLKNGQRVVLLQDVTEQRNIENRRAMLSRAIAHDLRNPISAIGGFADLISRFGDLNEQQEKYLLRIKQTSNKLHDMVKTLVDLAWIEAGMPLAHVPIRLHDIIHNAARDIAPMATRQGVGIAISIQNPLPIVMGDPARLKMVIERLLHNATIYTRDEGSIAIHAWGDAHAIYCSVADRGIGIIDSELDLIFDRMYRSRDERVREIQGGGLGLTLAQTIVRRHGGKLWATSQLDEGSTFTFSLPVVET